MLLEVILMNNFNLLILDYDILIANPIRLVGILEMHQDLKSFNEVTYLVIGKIIILKIKM
jgi:hypothetical protein